MDVYKDILFSYRDNRKLYKLFKKDNRYFVRSMGFIFFVLICFVMLVTAIWLVIDKIGGLLLWGNKRFNIAQIDISGNSILTQEEILEYTGLKKDTNLFKINIRKLRDQILKSPAIREVFIIRILPDTLKIRIYERVPVVIFYRKGNMNLVADKGGVVFWYRNIDPSLVLITGYDSIELTPGKTLQGLARDAIDLVTVIEEMGLGIELVPVTIDIKGTYRGRKDCLRITFKEGYVADIWWQRNNVKKEESLKDLKNRLNHLVAMIRASKREGSPVKYFDVSLDNYLGYSAGS